MIINRSNLRTENTSIVKEVPFKGLSLEGLRPAKDDIRVELSVFSSDTGFNIKGTVEAQIIEKCDRCLSDFKQKLSIRLQIILTRKEELITNYKEGEIFHFPDNQNEFNLVPILRDAIFLERTMKHLCKENCQGLCANCGTNLNETQCDCKKEVIDERWAPLLNLK